MIVNLAEFYLALSQMELNVPTRKAVEEALLHSQIQLDEGQVLFCNTCERLGRCEMERAWSNGDYEWFKKDRDAFSCIYHTQLTKEK